MVTNHYIGRNVKSNTPEIDEKNLIVWKVSNLRLDTVIQKVILYPLSGHNIMNPIGMDAEAECGVENGTFLGLTDEEKHSLIYKVAYSLFKKIHSPVAKYCYCGFYAYTSREDAEDHNKEYDSMTNNNILLEVKASGKYIQYQKGIRYAHQRVMRIIIGKCEFPFCEAQACLLTEAFLEAEDHVLSPRCIDHSFSSRNRRSFAEIEEKIAEDYSDKHAPITIETADGSKPWEKPMVEHIESETDALPENKKNKFVDFVLNRDYILLSVVVLTSGTVSAFIIGVSKLLW